MGLKKRPANERPRVALLIETSLASGRDILRGVASYVREHEPWALYHEPHAMEQAAPRWLRRWRGDGIIARIQTASSTEAIARCGVPVVDVLGVSAAAAFPLVHVDNAAIARMAAEHFTERGLQNFGFFGIQGENWSEQRYVAFCAAVAPLGHEVALYDQPRRMTDARSWERMEDQLALWVSRLPRPCGVLVCSDQCGQRFLEACQRANVLVPDDVAVIGVDNDDPLCEVCAPPLSSIDANHVGVGYAAAELLDGLLRGRAAPDNPLKIVPRQVIARLSTDVLTIADPDVAIALRLIRERSHEGLHVDAIARELRLSRSVLQRRFRSHLNRSIHQEILNAKVKRARELLIKTNLPIAAVAERAGFKHQEYMGAVFKARIGMTPGAVRGKARAWKAGRPP